LLKKASRRYGINLKNSYFIGDTIRDVLTARAAGAKAVLVLCGREKLSNEKEWEAQPDLVFKNLFEAARFLVEKNK